MNDRSESNTGEAGAQAPLDILLYHSIGPARKPLVISPDVFRMHLDVLAECGCHGASLVQACESPVSAQGSRAVALTFDDGYKDFIEVAVPELEARGWSATVFLCSGLIGVDRGWDPDGGGAIPMLNWSDAERLAAGHRIEIGSHGISHRDLTSIPIEIATSEIVENRRELEHRTGAVVTSFAMPYGRSTAAVREVVRRAYQRAVGTSLGRAHASCDPFDLPRIEMWYFQNARRWRAYLEGATAYMTARRGLRRVGSLLRTQKTP